MIPAIDPRLVFFARDGGGRLVACLFAYPDLYSGSPPSAVVLKTYATIVLGAGQQLVDIFHRQALELGYRDVIHALMHEANLSTRISTRGKSRPIRRYALFARAL